MEVLASLTQQLKESVSSKCDEKSKEEDIFEHIRTAETLNCIVDDFPLDLDWLNTSQPLSSSLLKGKIVVLDFFTYCCINCLHIIPHLRQLEENFSVADGLVVIGVHSAKFENEKISQNILLALKRYNITHPVVNDKNCYLWNKLGISCWPTILILGPKRQPIFCLIGEGHKDELLLFVKVALKFYKNDISSHHLPLVSCDQIVTSSLLSFPGKITKWNNLFAVSDSGNHRIIVFNEDGVIKFKIGGKTPGFKDGSLDSARFNSPQGVVFYSAYVLYVADTKNHAIRMVDLETLKVTTVVGNGCQGTDNVGNKTGKLQEISSPWDVCIVPCSDVEITSTNNSVPSSGLMMAGGPALPPLSAAGDIPPPPPPSFSPPLSVASGTSPTPPLPPPPPPPFSTSTMSPRAVPPALISPPSAKETRENICQSKVLLIAASGTHQIWAYFLEGGVWWKGKKYDKDICLAIAGTGKEENRNNRYPLMASFAQPSGLCYSQELKLVFIADSESSSIRKLSLKDGTVSHVIGGARSPDDLFSYGDVDGRGYDAKLQHPLGVAWNSKENSVFVCDTYNHKIKKITLSNGYCESIHKTSDLFNEPSGCCFSDSDRFLYVADTNNNCIKVVDLKDRSVKKFDIKEYDQHETESHIKEVWEEEVFVSKSGGTLALTVSFTPPEIRGTWTVKLDESKIKTTNLKGKLRSNEIDLPFSVCPSEKDDFLEIYFSLVLCGSEICNFKKFLLKLHIRKKELTEKSFSHKVFINLNNLVKETNINLP